jgi:hypothetical protein
MAASEAAMEEIWLKKFITKLGVVPSASDPPWRSKCSNNGA